MRKTDAAGGGRKCPGCTEKSARLNEALRLIKRGVKMLNRTGWESGETDEEWKKSAESFLVYEKLDAKYEKESLRTQDSTEPSGQSVTKPKG